MRRPSEAQIDRAAYQLAATVVQDPRWYEHGWVLFFPADSLSWGWPGQPHEPLIADAVELVWAPMPDPHPDIADMVRDARDKITLALEERQRKLRERCAELDRRQKFDEADALREALYDDAASPSAASNGSK